MEDRHSQRSAGGRGREEVSAAEDSRGPIRTCIGCRGRFEQGRLFRVAKQPDGQVLQVQKGAAPGRSAYICPEPTCIEAALGKQKLARALKTTIGTDRLEALKKELICKLQQR